MACCRAALASLAGRDGSGVSVAKSDSDQAMTLLRKAVAMGYRVAADFRTESDFDPLRERDDFKELLAELEAKSKAGKK